jgi:hypothetical protein
MMIASQTWCNHFFETYRVFITKIRLSLKRNIVARKTKAEKKAEGLQKIDDRIAIETARGRTHIVELLNKRKAKLR